MYFSIIFIYSYKLSLLTKSLLLLALHLLQFTVDLLEAPTLPERRIQERT